MNNNKCGDCIYWEKARGSAWNGFCLFNEESFNVLDKTAGDKACKDFNQDKY